MKKLLLVGVIVIVFVAFSFSANAFAHYNFLSPESNIALDILKEKFREKEIVLGSEDEVSPKVSYQYYYSVVEDVVKVEFVTDIKDKDDQVLCAEVVDAKIGDIFIGVSRTYVLQEQTVLTRTQIEYLSNQGIIIVGEWVDEHSD